MFGWFKREPRPRYRITGYGDGRYVVEEWTVSECGSFYGHAKTCASEGEAKAEAERLRAAATVTSEAYLA